MYLLDTDTLIYWLNGNQNIEQKALHVGLDNLYYSIISKAELYFGAYNSSSVQQNLSNIQTLAQSCPCDLLMTKPPNSLAKSNPT